MTRSPLKGRKIPHDQFGEKHWRWKGGRLRDSSGYITVLSLGHPKARKGHAYVREHVLVMEKYLGRYLKKDEHVHHINHDKTDNRIENLLLLSKSEHTRLHNREAVTQSRECRYCRSQYNVRFGMRQNEPTCKRCYARNYTRIRRARKKEAMTASTVLLI